MWCRLNKAVLEPGPEIKEQMASGVEGVRVQADTRHRDKEEERREEKGKGLWWV